MRGRLCYFGKTADDPQGEKALERWLDEKDDLLAGRIPRRAGDAGPTVRDLCEDFLQAKARLVESGELSRRSFLDYRRTTDGIVGAFGRHRLLDDLRSGDFDKFRAKLARRLGPVSLGNEINRVRVVFRFGYESDLIDRPVKFGPHFKRPAKRVLRLERKKNGLRMFESAELRTLLDKAGQPLRAMILLGINGGLGASDLARLEISSIDMKGGWIDYPRPKTGIDRRIPLWPETVAALKEAIAQRPAAKDRADIGLVFLTTQGNAWVRFSPMYQDEDGNAKGGVPLDAIGQKFAKLLEDTGLKRPRLGFYALRHTVETIGGDAKDQVALDAIMGHTRDDMASLYRERISDDRLRAVADHVRKWLSQTKKRK
ncbi:MAG: tyrosine-type recombinase/integrase [Pirellulales bacterium]|nr:tyrosine-type recombinase/integrase [Pirellulales bacterium]